MSNKPHRNHTVRRVRLAHAGVTFAPSSSWSIVPCALVRGFWFSRVPFLKQGLRLKGISLEAKTLRRITSHCYEFRKEAK